MQDRCIIRETFRRDSQILAEELSMANLRFWRGPMFAVLGFALGIAFAATWEHSTVLAQREATPPPPPTMADVQRLKDITPPMSHPMADAAFNATNLWFAGEKKNWPLANYFLGETRNRI